MGGGIERAGSCLHDSAAEALAQALFSSNVLEEFPAAEHLHDHVPISGILKAVTT